MSWMIHIIIVYVMIRNHHVEALTILLDMDLSLKDDLSCHLWLPQVG